MADQDIVGVLIPYHMGGGTISANIQYIEQKKLPVDVIFMGTSRVRNSIIPAFFDSLTNRKRNSKNISFNLAMPATRIGENLYLLKHFSRSKTGRHLKIAFIEWADTYFPHPDNRGTEKARYWMDAPIFYDYLLNVVDSHGPAFAWSAGHITYITSAFIHRTFSLAPLGQSWMQLPKPDEYLDKTHGYKFLYGHATTRPDGPMDLKTAYFDSNWIRLQLHEAKKLIARQDIMPINQDLKLWNKWLRRMKQQGVHIVLLMMPGQMSERQVALARSIPRDHVIDLSDPYHYADLYDPSLYHDRMHFNYVGARLLTRNLAEAWNRMSP